MIKLICDKTLRIIKNKKNLEENLEVKITNRGKEIYVSGNPENEYLAQKVIEALEFGFPFSAAIGIKKEELIFRIINIKNYSNQKNYERVRGRFIGKNGKTIKTISNLSECYLEIKDNKIGIIGEEENIENAEEACKLLLKGSKQSNVYAYLEKHHPIPIIDLGLKDIKKK